MREQAASDKPVALLIALSENASSLGAISRLNLELVSCVLAVTRSTASRVATSSIL